MDAMTLEQLGAALRAQREATGLNLEEVAFRIKVSTRTLRAIENGQVGDLPHAVYARGFIKSYGELVGLDPVLLAQGVDALFPCERDGESNLELGPIGREKAATMQASGGLLPLFLGTLVAVMLLGGGWYVYTQFWASGDTPAISNPFIRQTTPVAANANGEGAQIPPSDGGELLATNSTVVDDATATSAVVATALQGDVAAVGVAIPAVASGEHQVVLTATEACHVESTVDGALRRLELQAGDMFVLRYKSKISIKLGNAGGVTVQHDGQDVPLSARSGQVRTLTFP